MQTAPHQRSTPRWLAQLDDARGKEVVFLSHCLLNVNTRYLGGAGRRGSVRDVVDAWLARGVGIVQMPCPEAEVWGGVLKRRLLALYGLTARHPILGRLVAALQPLLIAYVRFAYRRIARDVARRIEEYVAAGFTVRAIVGIDGSPSCGVDSSIAIDRALRELMSIDVTTLSVAEHNALIRRHATRGRGLFIEELSRALRDRGLDVPFTAHDLWREQDTAPTGLRIVSS